MSPFENLSRIKASLSFSSQSVCQSSVVRTYVDFEVNTEINVPNRSVANACRREGRKTETAAMKYHVSPCDFSIPMQAYNENRHRRKRRGERLFSETYVLAARKVYSQILI